MATKAAEKENLIGPSRVAEILDVSVAMVRTLADTAGLPHHPVGARNKYYESEVREWVAERKRKQYAAPKPVADGPQPVVVAAKKFDRRAAANATRRKVARS